MQSDESKDRKGNCCHAAPDQRKGRHAFIKIAKKIKAADTGQFLTNEC
jgi:hypothetical protein